MERSCYCVFFVVSFVLSVLVTFYEMLFPDRCPKNVGEDFSLGVFSFVFLVQDIVGK